MPGFFQQLDLVSKVRIPAVARCGQCGLYRGCRTPKMAVAGSGKKRVLVIGEAPGRDEDRQGQPFVGVTGQLLQSTLDGLGLDLRYDCWITNSIICHPPGDDFKNDRWIDDCRPNLIRTIKELEPDLIVPLGAKAVRSLIGWLWREDTGPVGRWVGWKIPCRDLNAWICPAWHPSYVHRYNKDRNFDLVKLLWKKQLKNAVDLAGKGPPWGEVWPIDVKTTLNPDDVVQWFDKLIHKGNPIAFDYETDRLKPDHPDARIVSCAVSDGEGTLAYPWYGEAIKATRRLLMYDLPKWGWNLRFENRWTMRAFGRPVRNWQWDGMLAAHVLDNRRGTKSLKFQAFVRLGVAPWDEQVSPFMKSDGTNTPNRITDVPIETLLKYNAMDALLEWQMASLQREELGYE